MKMIDMPSLFGRPRHPGQGRLNGRNGSTTTDRLRCRRMGDMTTTPGAGLGAMIRTWRDRLPPSAAALPVARTRRAAGLRREELAELAGVSVDYVVRLEQGRATTPSAQVVASLARALQLSTAERDHLYRLARLVPPADDAISDHIPPGVHRVLTRLGDAAVAVFAADWQLIWWNRSWAALLGDPSTSPRQLRNFARDRFPVDNGPARLARWPVTERDSDTTDAAVVSDLRRATGRFPRDTRLAELIRVLSAGNQRFAELWATGTVAAHREDHKTIQHPSVGPITVDCDVLTDGDSELKIVIMTAVPGSTDETKLQLAAIENRHLTASG
jgi:transcriptional regulator with XRE-family HTH domain